MFYLFKRPATPRKLASICKTPRRLARWLRWNIKYVTDKKKHGRDHWQKPTRTLRDRTGDCDDTSLLANAVLKMWGFKPMLIGAWKWPGYHRNKMVGHLVAAFRYKNRYYHISNWGMKKAGKSIQDIPVSIYKKTKIWRVLNEDKDVLEQWVLTSNTWRRTD